MNHSFIYSVDQLLQLADQCTEIPKEFDKYLLKKAFHFGNNYNNKPKWKKKTDVKKSWLVQKGGSTLSGDEKLLAEIKGTLNKISIENYKEMVEQLKKYDVRSANNLTGFVRILFNKALNESHYINIYVQICKSFMQTFIIDPMDDRKYTFRTVLLNTCQESFEKYTSRKEKFDNDEDELRFKAELFGCIKFIGELYNVEIINNEILRSCVLNLISKVNTGDKFTIETLCTLIEVVGDQYNKRDKDSLRKYVNKINSLTNTGIKPRLVFMIEDLMDIAKEREWLK